MRILFEKVVLFSYGPDTCIINVTLSESSSPTTTNTVSTNIIITPTFASTNDQLIVCSDLDIAVTSLHQHFNLLVE